MHQRCASIPLMCPGQGAGRSTVGAPWNRPSKTQWSIGFRPHGRRVPALASRHQAKGTSYRENAVQNRPNSCIRRFREEIDSRPPSRRTSHPSPREGLHAASPIQVTPGAQELTRHPLHAPSPGLDQGRRHAIPPILHSGGLACCEPHSSHARRAGTHPSLPPRTQPRTRSRTASRLPSHRFAQGFAGHPQGRPFGPALSRRRLKFGIERSAPKSVG